MNAEVIALHDDHDLHAKACGKITFWTLKGDAALDPLVAALDDLAPWAVAPDAPSPQVALHRAVVAVARETLGEVQSIRRGLWSIVGKPREEQDTIVYDVRMTARLGGADLVLEGPGSERIREQFELAKASLSPADVSAYFTRRLEKLGAVALRESGGFYFVPRDVSDRWDGMAEAVRRTTGHTIHAIPALRSKDAIDTILGAITQATETACEQIAGDVASDTLGRRALETRQKETQELLDRVARYEGLLGMKLDQLREATQGVRAAIATAILSLANDADAE